MKTRPFLSLLLALPLVACGADPAAPRKPAPPPITNPPMDDTTQTATLAAGCFWCVEAVLQRIQGVEKIVSGYIGGSVPSPTYDQICEGTTGHAEAVQVTFKPAVLSYEKLLEVFWQLHDPTTLNRQGGDVGTQYRSAIFYHSDEQKKLAEASKKKHQSDFKDPIVTEITKAAVFYPAEDYHQNYFNLNKDKNPYCRVVIWPKLKKLGIETKPTVTKP
jgi:peptide-methionine (S)-S-oxide reductase